MEIMKCRYKLTVTAVTAQTHLLIIHIPIIYHRCFCMKVTMKPLLLTVALLLVQMAMGLTPAEWRSQSIYFLLTDRFGREDNSTTAACNTGDRVGARFWHIGFWRLTMTVRSIVVVVGKGS